MDEHCKQKAATVGLPCIRFHIGRFRLLARQSLIVRSILRVVPKVLQNCSVYISDYPTVDRYPSRGVTYNALRIDYFWTYIANNIFIRMGDIPDFHKQGKK